jgi:PAS domain S-box-containing protein
LNNSTTTLLNMVRTTATAAIKNYLKATGDRTHDSVAHFYNQYRGGRISEAEAKRLAGEVISSQKIGRQGYVYCFNSKGIVTVHPKTELIGKNTSNAKFIPDQYRGKKDYFEYSRSNPGEQNEQTKAIYMTYFAPWDWIIWVSAYNEKFNELVKVNEFRDRILSLRFGKTGYPFIMDSDGTLIIHPELEGKNIKDAEDCSGKKFIREILEQRNGEIIYPWKDPEEDVRKKNLVIYHYIPELKWIVASSCYLEELLWPLNTLRNFLLASVLFSILLFIPITLIISSSITNPLRELMKKISAGATGDFSVRMENQFKDEVGQLSTFFNYFMEKLETYAIDIQKEIQMRTIVEEALRLSEEIFSKAFRLSPNGICIISLRTFRFVNVNDSLLHFSGYRRTELVGRNFYDTGVFPGEQEGSHLLRTLEKDGRLRNHPIEFMNKDKGIRMGVISAEIIELWDERCMLASIEDVTETHRLEKEIMEITEKERYLIGQDLHDDLCPHLIGIEALAMVLYRNLHSKNKAEATQAEKIRCLITEAIHKSRILARGLCPMALTAHGFKLSIEELAGKIQEVFGIMCRFECKCRVDFRNNAVSTQLYYIIREAVYNAAKHAHARQICIQLSERSEKLHLSISDDGKGISKINGVNGMGLQIMRFRAAKIGATLNMYQDNGKGTRINVEFRKQTTQIGNNED